MPKQISIQKKRLFFLFLVVAVVAIILIFLFPHFRQGTTRLDGNYIFEKTIYLPLYSSRMITDDYVEYYTFTEDTLLITDADGNREEYAISYQKTRVSPEVFAEEFHPVEPGPDISEYQNCYLLTDDEVSYPYRLYSMDGELWLADFDILYITNTKGPTEKKARIGSIFQIVPYDGEIPGEASTSPPEPTA